MALPLTTDIGEEYFVSQNPDADTITWLLFDNDTDDIQESDDLAAITSEPDDTESYERQSDTVSTAQLAGSGGGDFGYSNDTEVEFDVDTNTEDPINAIGYIATFESEVAGDTDPEDHLIAADNLATDYDLGPQSAITFEAGDIEHVITGTVPE